MLTRGNERPIAVTAINVGFRNRIATCGMRRCAPEPSPWFSQIWKLLEERLVVLERIRRRLGLDLYLVPQALIAEHVDVVFLPIDLGFHVEKQREEARRDLIFRPPAVGPGAGRRSEERRVGKVWR